jgi:serine/threonine protein kinase
VVLLLPRSDKRFSIATALNIGIQIITRLEMIHRKGFVHRDIKANNFMTGRGEKARIVYIIDFGLAKRYFDPKTNKHIPVKGGKSLVGTARYASIASHEGFEQCRRDDLESLGYLLLYFLRGKLPWQGVQIQNKVEKYAEIGRMKKQARIDELCFQLGEDLRTPLSIQNR